MIEKKPLFDTSRIATTIVLVLFIFVASLLFLGSWNKADANSKEIFISKEKININQKDIESESIQRNMLQKSFDKFSDEQRIVNCKILEKLDKMNESVIELKYQANQFITFAEVERKVNDVK